jgi:hypothetical protein
MSRSSESPGSPATSRSRNGSAEHAESIAAAATIELDDDDLDELAA